MPHATSPELSASTSYSLRVWVEATPATRCFIRCVPFTSITITQPWQTSSSHTTSEYFPFCKRTNATNAHDIVSTATCIRVLNLSPPPGVLPTRAIITKAYRQIILKVYPRDTTGCIHVTKKRSLVLMLTQARYQAWSRQSADHVQSPRVYRSLVRTGNGILASGRLSTSSYVCRDSMVKYYFYYIYVFWL